MLLGGKMFYYTQRHNNYRIFVLRKEDWEGPVDKFIDMNFIDGGFYVFRSRDKHTPHPDKIADVSLVANAIEQAEDADTGYMMTLPLLPGESDLDVAPR